MAVSLPTTHSKRARSLLILAGHDGQVAEGPTAGHGLCSEELPPVGRIVVGAAGGPRPRTGVVLAALLVVVGLASQPAGVAGVVHALERYRWLRGWFRGRYENPRGGNVVAPAGLPVGRTAGAGATRSTW